MITHPQKFFQGLLAIVLCLGFAGAPAQAAGPSLHLSEPASESVAAPETPLGQTIFPAPHLLLDINPGPGSSRASDMAAEEPLQPLVIGDIMYFPAVDNGIDTGNMPGRDYTLWKTDGTSQGTQRVKDPTLAPEGPYYVHYLTNANGTLFFMAADSSSKYKLWKSDGTAAGTMPVGDALDYTVYSEVYAHNDGFVYFSARNDATGPELWKSDGTDSNTVMVRDIFTGTTGSLPRYFNTIGNRLTFFAYNGSKSGLWSTDGTFTNTLFIETVNPGDKPPVKVGNQIFFEGSDGTDTTLWKSDGAPSGTQSVKDINPIDNPNINLITAFNDKAFFMANDSVHGHEPWISGGTFTTTYMLKDIGPASSMTGFQPIVFNGQLYFLAATGSETRSLYRTDGTTAGTVEVMGSADAAACAQGGTLPDTGQVFLFSFGCTSDNYEPWISDGTAGGTLQIGDIDPSDGSFPYRITNVNDKVFFQADDGVHGREWWVSDTRRLFALSHGNRTPQVNAGYTFTHTLILDNVTPAPVGGLTVSTTLPGGWTLDGEATITPARALADGSVQQIAAGVSIPANSAIDVAYNLSLPQDIEGSFILTATVNGGPLLAPRLITSTITVSNPPPVFQALIPYVTDGLAE